MSPLLHSTITAQPPSPVQIAIGLGANIGDRVAALNAGVRHLEKVADNIACSSVFESPPLDCEKTAGPFLNMVLTGTTQRSPIELLAHCQDMEARMGRTPRRMRTTGSFQSRKLDLDILRYGDFNCTTPELILPHPELRFRPFVLLPLAQLMPDWQIDGGPSLADLATVFRDRGCTIHPCELRGSEE